LKILIDMNRKENKMKNLHVFSQQVIFIVLIIMTSSFVTNVSAQKKIKTKTPIAPTTLHLDFSTLLGGTGEDRAHGMAVDRQGNIYLTAPIQSTDFPTTPNAITKEFTGVYVAKLNSAGALLYSTFLGAPGGANYAHGIAVDKEGCIYIAGNTTNPNFPTTQGAFQTTLKGPSDANASHGDAFVVKLNSTGDRIIYSTFLGGTDMDICGKIAVDAKCNAYVVGSTSSKDFPVTPGAFDTTFNGGGGAGRGDIFVAKINPDGSKLVYCTYLGGTGIDLYDDVIIVDTLECVYVGGMTTSPDFPTTGNAYQRNYSGDSGERGTGDAFLVKLNPAGTALEYATYVGGSGDEIGRSIALDRDGNVWLAGETTSTDFPATADALGRRNKGGTDGFFLKINPRSGKMVYSSLLGGSKEETMRLAVHRSGLVVLTGQTESNDFPMLPTGIDSINGQSDLFVALFDASGKSLRYSNSFGGQGIDNPSALICREDNIYIAGNTTSADFPVTTGERFQGGTNPWGGDAFVMKCILVDSDVSKKTGLNPRSNRSFSGIAVGERFHFLRDSIQK
jgi:hypothetical protein